MANYDHPSFITRQMEYIGVTSAGNAAVSFKVPTVTAMRLRRFAVTVAAAGTSTGAAINIISVGLNGTSTTTTTVTAGTLTLSTATVGAVLVSTDCNYTMPVGAYFAFQNGTDATATGSVLVEFHLDPLLATFSNP